MQAVRDRLLDQRMVGNLPLAGQVFGAGKLVREYQRQKVLGVGALKRRRQALAVSHALHRERDARVPAPASREHRRIQERLNQQLAHGSGAQVVDHVGQRKAVGRAEGQHDAVIKRARLQFEVKFAAETLAQRKTPGAV